MSYITVSTASIGCHSACKGGDRLTKRVT